MAGQRQRGACKPRVVTCVFDQLAAAAWNAHLFDCQMQAGTCIFQMAETTKSILIGQKHKLFYCKTHKRQTQGIWVCANHHEYLPTQKSPANCWRLTEPLVGVRVVRKAPSQGNPSFSTSSAMVATSWHQNKHPWWAIISPKSIPRNPPKRQQSQPNAKSSEPERTGSWGGWQFEEVVNMKCSVGAAPNSRSMNVSSLPVPLLWLSMLNEKWIAKTRGNRHLVGAQKNCNSGSTGSNRNPNSALITRWRQGLLMGKEGK